MAERVLLTGAAGFVGRAILTELTARGIAVEPVSRTAPPGWHQADLLDPADRARLIRATRADTLIHAAWYVEHGAFWTSPLNADWRAASTDLAAAFLTRGKRIVALGTCAEYATDGPPGPWPESRAIAPATAYGQAKAALHRDLAALTPDHLWLRLFHLYGPGEPPARLIPALITALRRGDPAPIRAAGLIRDFASTAHVARQVADLIATPAKGAYNLGSGAQRSLGALGLILAQHLGRPDLLRLTHAPGPADPPLMAPDLTRLFATIPPRIEAPEAALPALADRSAA